MPGKNVNQITNVVTALQDTDKLYAGRDPFGENNDIAYSYLTLRNQINGIKSFIQNGGNLGTTVLAGSLIAAVVETTTAAAFTASAIGTAGIVSGLHWWFKNNSSGYLTFQPASPNTIDGSNMLILAPGEAAHILCNGTTFEIISAIKNSSFKAVIADYTLAPGDHGKTLMIASGNPTVAITVPAAVIEPGFKCDFIHAAAGSVAFVPEDNDTAPLYSPDTARKLRVFSSGASIVRFGSAYFLNGDLVI